jgi:hypothetical protein
MKVDSHPPFNTRAFVTLAATGAGLGLPVTGLANHLLATGQMTTQRHAWMAAHNSLGVLFLVLAIWHVFLNRRAFLKYLRKLAAQGTASSREARCAAGLVAIVLFLSIGHVFHS